MRTLLLVFCGLLVMNLSLEAKKKVKAPPSQKTQVTKQHKAMVKKYTKSRKAPKHRQKVN